MYFNDDQTRKAFNDIQEDIVYDDLVNQQPEQLPEINVTATAVSSASSDAFSQRW